MKRLLAVLAASVLLVSLIAYFDTRNGTRTDGLYYKASGIHPDAQLLKVNGEVVSAEEYLYWLASVCDYLYSYSGGTVDFNGQVTEDMTYGEYAKSDAGKTVTLYMVIRAWAREEGLELREEDLQALEKQHQEYVTYYGSEEAYLQQIKLLGITPELMDSINAVPYLYAQLHDLYCEEGGRLRPSDEELEQFGTENGYRTAHLLYFPTAGLDDAGVEEARAKAQEYANRWTQAEDPLAIFAILSEELELSAPENGITVDKLSTDASVYQGIEALATGEISGVIQGTNGFYVAMRIELDDDALTEDLFNQHLQELQDSAKVDYNDRLYDSIDVSAFYTQLLAERTVLSAEMEQSAGE